MSELMDLVVMYMYCSGLADAFPEIRAIIRTYEAREMFDKYGIIFWPNVGEQ
jgi:hypothetical protein